jgi:hypothetical protein
METFGACVLISENTNIAPNFLENVSPGKLRAAAERASPGLDKDIKRLHQIVHPVSGAIFSSFKITDDQARNVSVQLGLRAPSTEDGREGVFVLTNLIALIHDRFEELIARPEVLNSGKLIMIRIS